MPQYYNCAPDYVLITADKLFNDYGLEPGGVYPVMSIGRNGRFYYVPNQKHDPTITPPKTSAWVLVFQTECEPYNALENA